MKIFLKQFLFELTSKPFHKENDRRIDSFEKLSEVLSMEAHETKDVHFFSESNTAFGEPSFMFQFLCTEGLRERKFHFTLIFPSEYEEGNYFKKLVKNYRKVFAGGGLVISENKNLLLIHRQGLWDLPKGKLELDESPGEGAIREVVEETGLTGPTILEDAGPTFHIFKRNEKWRFKITHWFYMSGSEEQVLVPQLAEEIHEVKWFSLEELNTKIPPTYPLIEQLISSACLKYLQ